MKNFDKYIQEQIRTDELNFQANSDIQQKLTQRLQANAANNELRRNQIIPFTGKYMVWKIGVAAMLVAAFIGYKQVNTPSILQHYADSTKVWNTSDTLIQSSAYTDSLVLRD